jgi:hypothetical protein
VIIVIAVSGQVTYSLLMNNAMSAADIEVLSLVRPTMMLRLADRSREFAHAAELGGVYAERAMVRAAGALADARELAAQIGLVELGSYVASEVKEAADAAESGD